MELPGGLLRDGRLRRDFRFKPVTGELERAIAESGQSNDHLAEQVSMILELALEQVAGLPVDGELVCALSCGDRHYLMHQLQALMDPEPYWVTASCIECSEDIQFQLLPGSLPVKTADENYPQIKLQLSIGEVSLRTPTGADEEAVAGQAEDAKAALLLLASRLLSIPEKQLDGESLSELDWQLIDQMLDQMSPQLGTSASMQCPYCSCQQQIPLDTYGWITDETLDLEQDIHVLAFHYHWSEQDILALPGARRKRYIKRIERSLGKYQAEDLIMMQRQGRPG